jgi:glycosyltransferase involved in cell wall biosynthesis
VREVIQDGVNGLLVDFFSPKQIADRVDQVLDHPDRMAQLRVKARETALERYDLSKLLSKHLQLITQVANRSLPATVGRVESAMVLG